MLNRKKIELLAPAKNLEYGKTAVRYGADAVYIAAESFGARASAGNSIDDIEDLCRYAHSFNAKVYATLNTIIYESELVEARKTAIRLYEAGADALIIQDMAFMQMHLPPIQLFASTQAHNYEVSKIKFLESCGIERFILARELNLEQIAEIRQNTEAELEFFVHGALCVSFSGRCYISHFEKGRSGNRGECSQLCRMKYDLLDKNNKTIIHDKYLLSPKDLNLSDYLEKLLFAGISSFKIEGRLKDLNYVKNITAFYRNKLDALFVEHPEFEKSSDGRQYFAFEPQPERSFNRGFTNYFIEGRRESVVNMNSPKSIGQFIGKVVDVSDRSFLLKTNEEVVSGDGLCFLTKSGDLEGFYVNKATAGNIFPNKIIDIPIGSEIYRNQDYAFDKVLENDRSERKLSVRFNVSQVSDTEILFSCKDDFGNVCEELVICEAAKSASDNIRSIIAEQLAKSGGTIFEVDKVEVSENLNCHLPKSKINAIRRKLFDLLLEKRIANYRRAIRTDDIYDQTFPSSEVDYTENVANSMAEQFYNKFGAHVKQKAFELLDDRKGLVLMTTKHCLKYEIGDCPRINKGNVYGNAEQMQLKRGKSKYRLEFNCKDCLMNIIAE